MHLQVIPGEDVLTPKFDLGLWANMGQMKEGIF
jgi:hypothetical protein